MDFSSLLELKLFSEEYDLEEEEEEEVEEMVEKEGCGCCFVVVVGWL
jgi:hypothetical protein